MKRLFSICVILSMIIHIRAERIDSISQGICFEEGLNWQQILAKARGEHKYIFVDCYTTWCGPCKQMEKDVYPLAKVGEVFNEKFISVKMQMDTSRMDNENVKKSYADAHYIQSFYKVNAFPTFLFFTPEGKLLYRSEGAVKEDAFRTLATEVMDPSKNYYSQLESFRNGKADLALTSWLARRALLLGDTVSSGEIARDYVLHLDKDSLLTKSNIEFMNEFTKSSTDKGFSLFYQYTDSINSIMGDDTYSQQLVQSILNKEIIVPQAEKAKQTGASPDWNRLASTIQKKYNSYYSERVITAARTSWALDRKNWQEYTHYLVLYMDKFGTQSNNGLMPSLVLNNYAWAVFQYSQVKTELDRALSWSKRAILMYPDPNWMDTYANLLYKLGQKKEAIMWEGVAAKLDGNNPDIKNNMTLMKSDKPTWPSPEQF